MQQLKIEVRVRDDEARAKRSTVGRRSTLRKSARWEAEQRENAGGKEGGRKMRGEEALPLRGYACNESVRERGDQQRRGESRLPRGRIRGTDGCEP